MNYSQTMSLIVIPQSIRRMLPAICNEFIMVLKDASLVFAISLMDITTISNSIMNSDGSYNCIYSGFNYLLNNLRHSSLIYLTRLRRSSQSMNRRCSNG